MNGHWLFYLLSLFLLCINSSVLDAAENITKELDEDEITIQRWRNTFGQMKKMIGEGIKFAMPHVIDRITDDDLQVSPQCRRALFQWISDIKTMKPWALEMADASAKIIDGVFSGTFASFGAFDQCLDTINPKKTLQGKYCSLEFKPYLPPKPRFYALNQRLRPFKRFENDTSVMGAFTEYVQLFYMFPLRLGVCVPSPCSKEDLSNMVNLATKRFLTINATVPRCEIKEPVTIEYYQIPIFCVILILVLCCIIGTSYDVLIFRKSNSIELPKDTSIVDEVMLAFSVPRNWNKLMDLEAGSESLSVLHGIRVFSMFWIILGHTYFHLHFNILRRLQITIELTSQFIFNAVTNATLVVDNFFFISGLLFVYVTIDLMKVMGKVPNPFYFFIHRFWRFWPIQTFFIGLSTILPMLSSGPTWHENIDPLVEGCKKDWWTNMLFINNLYRSTEKGCISYSWYLAADFQIYIFCIPIVVLIIRKPRIGLWINFVVMILSVIAVAVHNYVRDLPPAMLFTRADTEQTHELMHETYYTPYHHLGPFCIGLFVGHFLQRHKKPLKLHWSCRLLAWVAFFTFTSASLFGVHPWNQGIGETGKVATMLYASLSRMAWTLGIAWMTVACSRGCGGIIAPILRSKVHAPFSRLTFLVYMIHPLVQYVFYGTLRDGIQAKNHLALFICLAFIVVSYVLALILSLLLESPFINLGFVVFHRKEGTKKKKSTSHITSTSSPITSASSPEITPELVNGNAKYNRAYEPQNEIAKNSNGNAVASQEGDFICHF